jgi:hypothetical protein
LRAWQIIWKTPAVAIAVVLGCFGANQAGWSGAEAIVNGSSTGIADGFVTGIFALFGALIAVGTVLFVYKIAKHALWLMVPFLLYWALVAGAWNGVAGDFDAIRVEAIRFHKANAYALEHMSVVARLHSCKDSRIILTADAQALCASVLNDGS